MHIDGRSAVLVHLAYPSVHLQTPQRFNARCAERGVNAVLVPWQVHPDNLGETMRLLRHAESVAGAIITVPHKETAARFCDRLEGMAAQLEVANVIRREVEGSLTGRILDGDGFVGGLRAAGVALDGSRVLIVGAGGVALAIGAALISAGIGGLFVANRTRARAEDMVSRLGGIARAEGRSVQLAVADAADPAGMDLVINATTLGMHRGDALPLDPERLAPSTVVAEVVMAPEITPLLAAAAARGCQTVPGAAMIDGQIDPFIDFVLRATVAANNTQGE